MRFVSHPGCFLLYWKFNKGSDGFGCFVGGVAMDKEPSGFPIHLIWLTYSSVTFDRGALSVAKLNYESHTPIDFFALLTIKHGNAAMRSYFLVPSEVAD